MQTKTETIRIFLLKKTKDNTLLFKVVETGETRESTDTLFWKGQMETFFRGKNVYLEITIEHGSMLMKLSNSEQSKFKQLWNFYIRRKF